MTIDNDLELLVVGDLRRDEGFKSCVYLDSQNYFTIGIGTLVDSRAGGGITYEEAVMLCRNRVRLAVEELDRHLPWWQMLSRQRQRALINMAFNLGIGHLLGFRNTLAALKAGDYEGAAAGMLDSLWARQVGDRAVRLAQWVREG